MMDLTFEQAEIEFRPVLKWKAKELTRAGVEFDDAYQEARLALLRAMQTYRTDGGSKFGTYVRVVLNNAAANLVKLVNRESRRQRIPSQGEGGGWTMTPRDPLYLDDIEYTPADLRRDPEEALSRAQLRRVFEHFAGELSEILGEAEREVLRINLEPPAGIMRPGEAVARQTEIVAHLGITPGRYFALYRRVKDAAIELVGARPQFQELRGFRS